MSIRTLLLALALPACSGPDPGTSSASSSGVATSGGPGTSSPSSGAFVTDSDASPTLGSGGESTTSAGSGATSSGTSGLKLDVGADTDGLPPGCSPGTEFIYLLTNAAPAKLLRFSPATLALAEVGDADCTDQGQPYALAVSRDATIWAHWISPEQLFQLSALDAACVATGYDPVKTTYDFFGFGFVAPPDDIASERLFVAGGTYQQGLGNGTNLGVLDLGTFLIDERPALPGGFPPALTGNAAGDLWGLFVGGGKDLMLARVDTETAEVLESIPLPGLSAQNYALGFWGGLLYVFADARAFAVDPQIGTPELVVADLGHQIIGAGQSTCVPLIPQ